jgi:signal transduction histidine kinase
MRGALPIAAAAIGLAGSLAATLALHRAAAGALDRVLEERLLGAGETATRLLSGATPSGPALRAIMEANHLEGAYVVSPSLDLVADAAGAAPGKADLLRTDPARVERALRGEATVGAGFDVGGVAIEAAYFPLRGPGAGARAVLVLEAGEAFGAARARLRRALLAGVVLAAHGAAALALAAARFGRAEQLRREAAARAARGEAVAQMAAAVAHDVRNPLGIIRASVDLLRERSGGALDPRDRARLDDVLGEVERLRRLTQDFLDVAAEPALATAPTDLRALADEAARGSAALHPEMAVHVEMDGLPEVRADAVRLRRVLANLLANAAEAGARAVEIRGSAAGGAVRIAVRDDGPGIDPALRSRLFEPFASARPGGTGLGLALSRRIVERHGGTLALSGAGAGAVFEITLPRAPASLARRGEGAALA